ncbi:MAG: ribonuclease P protein component [Flavobacteriaceae bacterium]|nr:ribonuclease P protein component [Flavobacteriaceae bacterium]
MSIGQTMNTMPQTLLKANILSSKTEIDTLFTKGKRKQIPPLAVVYYERQTGDPSHKVLFVAPKKIFPRAVERNSIKRQLREIYRINQELFQQQNKTIHIALVALKGFCMTPTRDLTQKYKRLLSDIHQNT